MLSLTSAYLKPNTCESEKYKHANRSVAVCVTGLYRTAKHVMPHLRRQYPPEKFATFVVTDGIDKMRKSPCACAEIEFEPRSFEWVEAA